MKIKHIVIATTMMVSLSSIAQKDELKALKKMYAKEEIKGNDLIEYKSLVSKVEPLATEESDRRVRCYLRVFVLRGSSGRWHGRGL